VQRNLEDKVFEIDLIDDTIMPFGQRYNSEDYHVEKTAEYDDSQTVKPWQRWMIFCQPIIGNVSMIAYAIYFAYRLLVIRNCLQSISIFQAPVLSLYMELVYLSKNAFPSSY